MDKNLIIIISAWVLSEVATIRSLWLLRKRVVKIVEEQWLLKMHVDSLREWKSKIQRVTPPEPKEPPDLDNPGYTERFRGVDRHYDLAPPKQDYTVKPSKH